MKLLWVARIPPTITARFGGGSMSRYNTDEIEIFELHKKLNLALNLSNKAYISLNKLKKENELNAFKHEMNKLKTNFH